VPETVWNYVWTGVEEVRCHIEVEVVGDRRSSSLFSAAVRRIHYDGLTPLAIKDGRPAEWRETSKDAALARAKLFLDKRFGFGNVAPSKTTVSDLRVFPVQRVPERLTIAEYRRFGCPVCRIGEPNEDRIPYWIEHAQREHGYEVQSDRQERAPRLRNVDKMFRVVRLVRPPSVDAPSVRSGPASESLPKMMPRKLPPR
jgi:hypothetical protein